MADLHSERFECPHCQAEYKLVRVDAPVVESTQEIFCRSCDGPLQGRQGRFILKYFLVSKRRRRE
jgi:hypothetical protein